MTDPSTEAATQDRSARLLAGQNRVLRLLAEGKPLTDILAALCHALEEVMPGSACSILLLDAPNGQLRHVAAPSLPESFATAIDGVRIGPLVGSCGTAAYLQQPVIACDIATDPRWADWQQLATAHSFRACWSVPVFNREAGEVLGTFAVYYQEPRAPAEDDLDLVERVSDLAGVAILHDRERAALLQAKEAAEAANQAKSGFLAMANHELRTPLQAILGYAEFLLDDTRAILNEEQREDLGYIQQGGRRMLNIINDLLDLARIEANGLTLRRDSIDLVQVVEQVRQDVQPQAAQRGLDLQVRLPERLPPLHGDGERLRQILLNLAGNAVKFTDAGLVEIAVAVDGDWIVVRVRDTGYGIAPEALARIFDAYHQAEEGRQRRHGAGLGLAIAQRLATLMDGQITVESTPGVGSIFTLQVPVTLPPA
ncbi:MAG: GAF domain-containing sensor histidine kinase [Chloroflexota bacterium]|nr:GAF domain-containing sensor histidine kinase [Chloroflexota bacterium]